MKAPLRRVDAEHARPEGALVGVEAEGLLDRLDAVVETEELGDVASRQDERHDFLGVVVYRPSNSVIPLAST